MKIRPKVLVAKIGFDGHDRGSRVVAAGLRDAGMEVIYTPPWQETARLVKLAIEEDVDVIGISSLATDHLIVPKLVDSLREAGLRDVPVILGGIVPDEDVPALLAAGVARVFHPGSSLAEIAEFVAEAAARSQPSCPIRVLRQYAMNEPSKGIADPSAERWRREYAQQTGAERVVRNRSGIEIRPLYTHADWSSGGRAADLGYRGQPPYTRGIYPTMHRGRRWTQRQLIGLGMPSDYNARLKDLLASGANAISLIPCNSVFRGYDMDGCHPELLGTCGVVVATLRRALGAGQPLAMV